MWDPISRTGLATPECRVSGAGTNQCDNGVSHCRPDVAGYGEITNVSVPSGLLTRHTGKVGGSWQIITSNGKTRSISLWPQRLDVQWLDMACFRPDDGMNMVLNKKVPDSSFYMDGLVADDTYMYPIQWTGARLPKSSESITPPERFRKAGPSVRSTKRFDPINGQYDWSHGKVFMEAHRGERNAVGGGPGSGTEISSTRHLKRASRWKNRGCGGNRHRRNLSVREAMGELRRDDVLRLVGTVQRYRGGKYYGRVTQGNTITSLSAAYHSDGYVYNPRKHSKLLQRVKVSHAIRELWMADNDRDGLVDEDLATLGMPVIRTMEINVSMECGSAHPTGSAPYAKTRDLSFTMGWIRIFLWLMTTPKQRTASRTEWRVLDAKVDTGVATTEWGLHHGTHLLHVQQEGDHRHVGQTQWLSGASTSAHGLFQTNSGVNSTNWPSLFKWYGNIFYFRLGNSRAVAQRF